MKWGLMPQVSKCKHTRGLSRIVQSYSYEKDQYEHMKRSLPIVNTNFYSAAVQPQCCGVAIRSDYATILETRRYG